MARLAMTSLVFMLVCVPDPVAKSVVGNGIKVSLHDFLASINDPISDFPVEDA